MKRFKIGRDVVYASIGPAMITDIVTNTAAGMAVEMYVLSPHSSDGNAIVKVPVTTEQLRAITTPDKALGAMKKLTGVRKKLRGPPHKQLRQLEDNICSGDFTKLCEAVRDLYTDEGVERRHTRRMMYEKALRRLTQELSLLFDYSANELEALVEETIVTRTLPKELKTP